MEQTLPVTCQVTFKDPHRLHEFILLIIPDEGYWIGGHFYFQIYISEEYNMAVNMYSIIFMYYDNYTRYYKLRKKREDYICRYIKVRLKIATEFTCFIVCFSHQ